MRGFTSLINEVVLNYSEKVQFRFVYIAEAHAMDEWPVSSGRFTKTGKPVLVNQPKTLQDRCLLAEDFTREYNFHLETFVDLPEAGDPFEKAYAPWPLRFFLIGPDNCLAFVSEPIEGSSDAAFTRLLQMLEPFRIKL